MSSLFLLALAQAAGPDIVTRDPPQGVMPGENRTLSQPHRNMDDRMFPDIAVKDLRVDGDTLRVLVANDGRVDARTAIRLVARTRETQVVSRSPRLRAGESRWVALSGFGGAGAVSATVRLQPQAASLDRSGKGCDGCEDYNGANDSLTRSGDAIEPARPGR